MHINHQVITSGLSSWLPPTLTVSASFFLPTKDLLSICGGQALRLSREIDVIPALHLMGAERSAGLGITW